jgi:uncharacterized membrane protein YbhN (UPF0104 family)
LKAHVLERAATARPDAAQRHARLRRRAYRRRALRIFVAAMMLLAAWLVIDHARDIDWMRVRESLAAYPLTALAAAAALVVLSYLTYGVYDLLGRRYTGHGLRAPTVMAVAAVAYACNLNIGPIVGGIGLRLRLYTRLGVRAAQVARIVALAVVTNWTGYLLLAGLVLASGRLGLPTALGRGALQLAGAAMIAVPAAYVMLCWRARRREWHWRGHHFRLPNARMALAQMGASALNWALIGGVIWALLPGGVPYVTVLATLLSAAVAAAVTHIPGGLGVLEGVFVLALGEDVAPHLLVAALLAFRALYYVIPLAVAGVLYLALEAGARKRRLSR